MKIGKNKDTVISQTLEVDTWKRSYDKEDNLIEEEGGKKSMTEVKELKYLGFIIASSASNVPNILDRKKKLTNTCTFPNKETYVELPPILVARR